MANMHDRITRAAIESFIQSTVDVKLMNNTLRGFFVEHLIAAALGDEWSVTAEWDGWDLTHQSGHRLEVKQSALAQPWHDEFPPPKKIIPRFSIEAKNQEWTKAGWVKSVGRPADTYVFALHGVSDLDKADHRDASQWLFYVVPTQTLPSQKSITLNRVRKLAAECSIETLPDALLGLMAPFRR